VLNDFFVAPVFHEINEDEDYTLITHGMEILCHIHDYCHEAYGEINQEFYDTSGATIRVLSSKRQRSLEILMLNDIIPLFREHLQKEGKLRSSAYDEE